MTITKLQSEYPDLDKYLNENEDIFYCKKSENIKHNNSEDIALCFLMLRKHRLDGPAVIKHDGTKQYYLNNKLHRLNGPAIEWPDGSQEYYLYGEQHRLDGPAKILEDGEQQYYVNDKFMGYSKQELYNNIKNLKTKNINNQDKTNILNIKNSLSHNLDSSSFNILKSLL